MKKIVLLLLLLSLLNLYSQTDYTLSGYVKDKSSGETLIGATISVKDTKLGAVTNAYGFYSLTLPEADSTIIKVDGDQLTLLRHGAITADAIQQAIGTRVREVAKDRGILAPGMMESHYAPDASVHLD